MLNKMLVAVELGFETLVCPLPGSVLFPPGFLLCAWHLLSRLLPQPPTLGKSLISSQSKNPGNTFQFLSCFDPCLLDKSLLPWLSWSQCFWHSFSLSDHPCLRCWLCLLCLSLEHLLILVTFLLAFLSMASSWITLSTPVTSLIKMQVTPISIFFHPNVSPELQNNGCSYFLDSPA